MYRNIPQSLTSVFHIKYSSQTCDLRLSRMNWGFRVFAYHPFYSKSKSLSVILTNAETAPTPVVCHVNKLTARTLVPYGQYKNRIVTWRRGLNKLYNDCNVSATMRSRRLTVSAVRFLHVYGVWTKISKPFKLTFFFIARICMLAMS